MGDYINRFPVLFDDIKKSLDKKRAARLTEDALEVSMQHLLGSIRKFAPKGKVEPRDAFDQPSIRASERLHGTSLDATLVESDAIRHKSDTIGDSVTVTSEIAINHPTYNGGQFGIIEWLTQGTPIHRITPLKDTNRKYFSLFAIGDPPNKSQLNRLPLLKFYWFNQGAPAWAGHVDHPGARSNQFINRAVDEQLETLNDEFERATDRIAFSQLRTSDVLSFAGRSQ